MDYDEACIMHLTPRGVNNFSKAVSAYDFCPLYTQISQIPKIVRGNPVNSTIDGGTLPQDCVKELLCST